MDVTTQTNAVQGAAQASSAAQTGNASSAASALSSDFETFLLMLTTQMENQDPLNPVESEDFAVQLATFSGVEQQVRTNQLLESLAGGMGATGLAQLAGWVGMEARVTAPVYFDGSPVDLSPNPAPGADAAQLIVRDAAGNEVSREELPMGQSSIQWAGIGQTGSPLPSGSYTLQLESFSLGQSLGVSDVAHYARISEARQETNGVELVIPGRHPCPIRASDRPARPK